MYCELMERATVEPTGRYLAHEAGMLAGVPGDRIGQWARWGHIRASVSDGEPHVYAFADVAEALAVHLLLDAGLTLPVVRHAVERLGGLAVGVHVVDGRLAVERGDVLKDVFTEQTVLPLNGRVDPVDLLRRGGWPAHVLGELDAVWVDPARAGGRPCVRATRVPVEDAGDAAARRWWEVAVACAS
jgi:hypothetical protein